MLKEAHFELNRLDQMAVFQKDYLIEPLLMAKLKAELFWKMGE